MCRHHAEGRLAGPHNSRLHYTKAGPGRSRLTRGSWALRNRWWDEAIQKLAMTETREEMPWQAITEDHILRTSFEA